MKDLFILSLAVASISFTVSEMKVFLWLREWWGETVPIGKGLLRCGYCFGHWVAFVMVAIYRPDVVLESGIYLFDLFVTSLVIAWLAAFQWVGMCWAMEKVGK